MKSEKQRKKIRQKIAEQILFSKEAQEMLQVSRERLNQFVKDGRVEPIRKGVYLKDDILALVEERKEQGLQ